MAQTEAVETMINPNSPDPCNPGGGGVACIDAQGTVATASIDIGFSEALLEDNSAAAGGEIQLWLHVSGGLYCTFEFVHPQAPFCMEMERNMENCTFCGLYPIE